MLRRLFTLLSALSLLLFMTLVLDWASTGQAHLVKSARYVGNLHYFTVVPFTAVLPLIWFVRWAWREARRQRRVAAGLCLSCGYDLRGTPGRCPECGSMAPAAGVAS
jgi:hypothetical protein